MNVLVIGSNGYIGSAVVRRLLAQNHSVIALRRPSAQPVAVDGPVRPAGLRHLEGDFLSGHTWRDVLKDCDAVVIAADTGSAKLNHEGVRGAIAALAGTGKALVWASTTAIFASRSDGEASAETYGEDDARYLHPGSDERVAIEHTVMEAGACGVRGIVIRSPLVYGGSGSQHLAAMVNQARVTGVVNYVGPGQNRQSCVHVDDLAQAYVLALATAPAGSVWNAVAGEASMKDIAGVIAATHGAVARSATMEDAAAVIGLPHAAASACNRRCRPGRLQLLLGWKPSQPDLLTVLQRRGEWAHAQLNTLAAHSRQLARALAISSKRVQGPPPGQGLPATAYSLFPAIGLLHRLPVPGQTGTPAGSRAHGLYRWENG